MPEYVRYLPLAENKKTSLQICSLNYTRNLHPLPLNLIETHCRGAGHIERRNLPRHRDRPDPVAEFAYTATQADCLVADDQQGRCGEGAVGEPGFAVRAGADYLQARGLLAEVF